MRLISRLRFKHHTWADEDIQGWTFSPAERPCMSPTSTYFQREQGRFSYLSHRPMSYDQGAIAGDFPKPLYLHTRQLRSGGQELREVCMKSEKEIVALLREIRDFVQILVVRQQSSMSLDSAPPIQRNGRSWFLWGHRTHPRRDNQADETTTGC